MGTPAKRACPVSSPEIEDFGRKDETE